MDQVVGSVPPATLALPPPPAAAVPVSGAMGLCDSYFPSAQIFDELREPSGAVRPHWQMFVNLLGDLGQEELQRRWEIARQLIHDNGVTYNVYGDPAGMDRPWNLDAIPFVLGAEEWGRIEAGLAQRARLLDLILADLYGEGQLLKEGLIPPELVFGHRGFLRAMHGVHLPGGGGGAGRWLHFYAADIGRTAGGELCVMADRTQAPSGAGYALENRLVVSRALPDVFRDCRVQRLATFFRTVRDTLKSLALHNKESPRIVLLTPGPYNETYFEHAYLARYLGFTLVEGADLTVRDNHVYLKTLSGLQQVDVILRRQDDDFCDPLELRQDSSLGIAGLVQAVHSQNVVVANALGSGIMESAAWMMYLPRLARRLLGEELKLPSVQSYWCGDAAARQFVLENLPKMVIKPTFPLGKREPVFVQDLTQGQAAELRSRILAAPADYVAEEQISLSTAPVLVGNRIEPRHVVLRAHAVAVGENGSGGYALMPGGLTRFSGSSDSLTVSMQRGGGSKDTWITSAENAPVDNFSLLPPTGQPVEITRAGGDLPSRVADNLYWLGRYMERAEGVCRLARGLTVRLTDQNFESSPELSLLLNTLMSAATQGDSSLGVLSHPEGQIEAVLLDDSYPAGLQASLAAVYRNASLVRDRISPDTWRIINSFDRDLNATQRHIGLGEILPALDRLIITFAAFGGLAMESMTRGYAWRFLDMGRRIERALGTVHLMRGALVAVPQREGPLLEAVLEVADSAMTYRRRYMTTLQAAPVLDLLLADESNPRSAAFQLARLAEHIEALPRYGSSHSGTAAWTKPTPEERLLLRSLTALRLVDLNDEVKISSGRREHLDDFLHALASQLLMLSDTLSQTYLAHAITTRQLAAATGPLGAS